MTLIVFALVFATGFLLVFAANLLFADIASANRQRMRDRLMEETRLRQMERARVAIQHKDLYELAAEESSQLYSHKTLKERVGLLLEQAGVKTTPTQLIAAAVACIVVTGPLAAWLAGNMWTGLIVGPLFGCLPWLWVSMARQNRLAKLQAQLPDAFDLMSRTMRAGQTVSQALQSVSDEAGAPLAEEFGYCYDQQNLGMSPEAAMRDLARRTGLLEIKIFVLAVMVHRQTGGNLAELLEKLSFVIRERYRIQGMIKALTAEGKFQAIVLLALPIVLVGAMMMLNRGYALELFQMPALLVCTFLMMVAGAFWMSRIINFDF